MIVDSREQANMAWTNFHKVICYHIDGLMQERHNSIANALDLCLSCTNPSIWHHEPMFTKLYATIRQCCRKCKILGRPMDQPWLMVGWPVSVPVGPSNNDLLKPWNHRAANRYGISVFCTDFTCKIREYEFGLENTEIELCQFCHLKYCCQNKAYLLWVANQSVFVAFYALEPSNTSLITKTFNLLSSTCSSSMLSCITSCSCSTGSIH